MLKLQRKEDGWHVYTLRKTSSVRAFSPLQTLLRFLAQPLASLLARGPKLLCRWGVPSTTMPGRKD